MCISLEDGYFKDYDWADFFQKPLAGHLIHQTLEFRNDPPEGISCIASGARKFVAEISFALLAIVAVVEGVVRTLFCLIAVIPALCCCEATDFDKVVEVGALSAVFILDLFLRCFKGLIINPIHEWLEKGDEGLKMGNLEICELIRAEDNPALSSA